MGCCRPPVCYVRSIQGRDGEQGLRHLVDPPVRPGPGPCVQARPRSGSSEAQVCPFPLSPTNRSKSQPRRGRSLPSLGLWVCFPGEQFACEAVGGEDRNNTLWSAGSYRRTQPGSLGGRLLCGLPQSVPRGALSSSCKSRSRPCPRAYMSPAHVPRSPSGPRPRPVCASDASAGRTLLSSECGRFLVVSSRSETWAHPRPSLR